MQIDKFCAGTEKNNAFGRDDRLLSDAREDAYGMNIVGTFFRSMGNAAIQKPLTAMAQVADAVAESKSEWQGRVQFACLQSPCHAGFGSAEYWADQAGGAIGSLVPFYVAGKGVKAFTRTGLTEAKLAGVLSQRHVLGLTLKESFLTGFANDALFSPSEHRDNRSLALARTLNGLSSGLSMLTLSAASSRIDLNGVTRASHFSELCSAKNHMVDGFAAGLPAGFIGANSSAYLNNLDFGSTGGFIQTATTDSRFANRDELTQAMTTGAVIGGAFGAYHKFIGQHESARRNFTWEKVTRSVASPMREYRASGGERSVTSALTSLGNSEGALLHVRENLGLRSGILGRMGFHKFGADQTMLLQHGRSGAALDPVLSKKADVIASCKVDANLQSKSVLANEKPGGDYPVFLRAGKDRLNFSPLEQEVRSGEGKPLRLALEPDGKHRVESGIAAGAEDLIAKSKPGESYITKVGEEVFAYEDTLVKALKGSVVQAHKGSWVFAEEGAVIHAHEGAWIHALDGSEVHANLGSQIYAQGGSKVQANRGSQVTAFRGSEVHANDGSFIHARLGSIVLAHQGANVFGSNCSTIYVEKGSNVTVEGPFTGYEGRTGISVPARRGAMVIAEPGATYESLRGNMTYDPLYDGWRAMMMNEGKKIDPVDSRRRAVVDEYFREASPSSSPSREVLEEISDEFLHSRRGDKSGGNPGNASVDESQRSYRDKPTLAIVDMQERYIEADVPWNFYAVADLVQHAKANNWGIAVLEMQYGATHEPLLNLLKSYDGADFAIKRTENGSNELRSVCEKNGFNTDNFVMGGLYADVCVYKTVEGLNKILPDSSINIVKDACYPSWGKRDYNWGDYHQPKSGAPRFPNTVFHDSLADLAAKK